MSLRQFQGTIRGFQALTVQQHLRVLKAAGIDLLGRIVRATPVDTGAARANWEVGLNSPPQPPNIRPDDTSAGSAANEAIGRGVSEIGKLRNPFGSIVISNALPYIVRLENGHSQQAPSGMVAVSIQNTLARFKAVRGGII